MFFWSFPPLLLKGRGRVGYLGGEGAEGAVDGMEMESVSISMCTESSETTISNFAGLGQLLRRFKSNLAALADSKTLAKKA